MNIGEKVEFAETLIRADIVENKEVVSILPSDKRIKTFFDLKKNPRKRTYESNAECSPPYKLGIQIYL